MNSKTIIVALALFGFLAFFAVKVSAEGNALGYQVVAESSEEMSLKITVDAPTSGMWLGITLYPPNVKDLAKEGANKLFPLKNGHGIYTLLIEPRFKNGSFESAVWSKKLTPEECAATDTLCKSQGYKLSTMRGYVWGYLIAP